MYFHFLSIHHECLPSREVCPSIARNRTCSSRIFLPGELMVFGRGGDKSVAMLTKEMKFPVRKKKHSREREQQNDVICMFREG